MNIEEGRKKLHTKADTWAMVAIVLFGMFFYGATLRGVQGNPTAKDFKNNLDQNGKPFELSPERGRFVHLIALGDNHTFALDQSLAEVAYPDVGQHDGKYFSFFAPGIPYLALPAYLAGKHFGLSQVFSFGFISFVSILALLFLYKTARNILSLPVWASLLSVLIFAFGSTAWSYAVTLYQHHITVFFMISGFYAVWKYRQQRRLSWLWAFYAGAVYAASITIDSPNALLLMPVLAYLLFSTFSLEKFSDGNVKVSMRAAGLASLFSFAAVIGMFFYFNQHYFGSWHMVNGALPDYRSVYAKPVAAESSATTTATTTEASALTKPVEKNVVGFFHEQSIPQGLSVLLFSRDRGLFTYAPVFLLALLGIFYALRKRIEVELVILLCLVGVNVFLYSSWGDPWGGWAYGPRYLIPGMAILSLFIGVALTQYPRSWALKILAFLLFMYSSFIALLGALTTNANPGVNEALSLHTGYNFFRNWEFLQDDRGSGFIYSTYFHSLPLENYFFVIYIVLAFIVAGIFLISTLKSHES